MNRTIPALLFTPACGPSWCCDYQKFALKRLPEYRQKRAHEISTAVEGQPTCSAILVIVNRERLEVAARDVSRALTCAPARTAQCDACWTDRLAAPQLGNGLGSVAGD